MIFEALNKSKMCENNKGKKEIHPNQNWKNPDIETSWTISVFFMGDKVRPNSFAHPNLPTLIEPKPIQLLVGLNGH